MSEPANNAYCTCEHIYLVHEPPGGACEAEVMAKGKIERCPCQGFRPADSNETDAE